MDEATTCGSLNFWVEVKSRSEVMQLALRSQLHALHIEDVVAKQATPHTHAIPCK